jgi:transcriptional regulator with AAA-type ATPase domain
MTHASRGIDGLSAVSLRGNCNSFPGQDPATLAEQAATLASSVNTQMHMPTASRVKQPSEAQQASFWDQQIANGNLSMCSVKYPTYVNVMLYGESGLGKTVSAAAH